MRAASRPAAMQRADAIVTASLRTIPARVAASLARRRAALYTQHGRHWRRMSGPDLLRHVEAAADGLQRLGLRHGECLAIVCRTRAEWLIAELAAMTRGVVVLGIDPHANPAQIAAILADSRASALMVDSLGWVAEVDPAALASVRTIVVVDDDARAAPREGLPEVVRWADTMMPPAPARGARRGTPAALAAPAPQAIATMLFTSGTTGVPRAILYRQEQLVAACDSILAAFPDLGVRGASTICWLPMAALFQRMMNYVALASGVSIYVVEDPRRAVDAARKVQPAYFIGVPRFFEKLYQGIEQARLSGSRSRRRLLDLALARSPHAAGARPRVLGRVLDAIVLRRIRAMLGHRLRFMITGSAPAPAWMLEYFQRLGILLLEAYGLSENCVPIAANRPHAVRFGSVGKVFPGNDVRISDEGEILVRGEGLFDGYYRNGCVEPAPLTADGFYATGDLGHFDDDGFLHVTGRRTEAFKASTGRWVRPARIEAVYKRVAYIEQIAVVGRGRPYPIALLAVDARLLDAMIAGAAHAPRRAAAVAPATREARIAADLAAVGGELEAHERVQRFALLPRPLDLAHGELTSSLKLRRDAIEHNHGALIAAVYAKAA